MSVTFSAITLPAAGQEFGDFVHGDLDVNISNANARRVLESLGFTDEAASAELSGATSAEDFLGRVLLALAIEPEDPGVPITQYQDAPWLIDCGRRVGYLQAVLDNLRDLAEAAVATGRCEVQFA
jgi:hypothetical protein